MIIKRMQILKIESAEDEWASVTRGNKSIKSKNSSRNLD